MGVKSEAEMEPGPAIVMDERELLAEVDAAARYLTGMATELMGPVQLDALYTSLVEQMSRAYLDHWHPRFPERGSAFRSISCLPGKPDQIIIQAALDCGVDLSEMMAALPNEFVVWVNPGDVAVRLGEHGQVWSLGGHHGVAPDGYGGGGRPQFDEERHRPPHGSPKPSEWVGSPAAKSWNPVQRRGEGSPAQVWGDHPGNLEGTPESLRTGTAPSPWGGDRIPAWGLQAMHGSPIAQ